MKKTIYKYIRLSILVIIVLSTIGTINCQSSYEKHIWQGSRAYSDGKFDEAINEFSKAIEVCPDAALPYSLRADVYQQLGNYSLAKADLIKVIELSEEPTFTQNAEKRLKTLIEKE